jgi:undecaprenyl-diphosphatase
MILVDEFLKLNTSDAFKEMFLVLIQLGAILAVIVLYWKKLFPFSFSGKFAIKKDTMAMWGKILVGSLPACIIGLLFDDKIDTAFYNPWTVAIMLILHGILYIIVENRNKNRIPKINAISELTYKTAFLIGIFQMLALIPGTSRSGATIVGAILIGTSRVFAAEFTFFLAIPAMFGASALKLLKFGFDFTSTEMTILLMGMVIAFVVSVIAIKFLMSYIKKHDFTFFGWYRIVLGAIVILYFLFQNKFL